MLNARGGCMCIVLGLGGGGDEINDPVDSSYRVKSFIDACIGIFRGRVIPVTSKLALQCLPCQAHGIIESAL